MSDSHRAKLDDPALRGRLRSRSPARYSHRQVRSPRKHRISDFRPRAQGAGQETKQATPQQLTVSKSDAKSVSQTQKQTSAYPQKARQTSTARPAMPRQKRSAVLTREAVSKKKTKRVKQKTRPRNPVFVVGLVIGLLLSGAYIGYMTLNPTNTKVAVLSSQASEELVNGLPSEESVNAGNLDEYQVSPDLPRVLTISKIGVEARVKRLSIKDNNQLGSPANIFDTGWYEGSAKPGEGGVVLVSGHVAGPTKDGVFHRLGSISPDDTIKLERGDGKTFTYKVVTTKLYDHDKLDMVEILRSADPTKPGLNLITSSIRYDVRANKFEQRLVIFAVQQ